MMSNGTKPANSAPVGEPPAAFSRLGLFLTLAVAVFTLCCRPAEKLLPRLDWRYPADRVVGRLRDSLLPEHASLPRPRPGLLDDDLFGGFNLVCQPGRLVHLRTRVPHAGSRFPSRRFSTHCQACPPHGRAPCGAAQDPGLPFSCFWPPRSFYPHSLFPLSLCFFCL